MFQTILEVYNSNHIMTLRDDCILSILVQPGVFWWITKVKSLIFPGKKKQVRRYWPRLPDGALIADYSGVRPKLSGPGADV